MRRKMLVLFMAASMALPTNCYAQEEVSDESVVMNVCSEENIDSVANETEIIVLGDEVELKELPYDDVEELLDDGLTIYDMESDQDEVAEYFADVEFVSGENTIGYEIAKDGMEISITPIDVEVACEDGENVSDEEQKELVENVALSEDDYIDLNKESDVLHLEDTPDELIAYLQASSSIGSYYGKAKRKTYYYRVSPWISDTAAYDGSVEPGENWSKLGYGKISLYAYNAGGKGKKRYDAFHAVADIGGLNDYLLHEFTVQIRLYDQNGCEIVDRTHLEGNKNEVVTTSIGGELEAGGDGLSATFSAGYSYSYNPGGLKITNTMGDSEFQPNWICSKNYEDTEENECYIIKPMILVESPKGKTKVTKVSARIKNIKITSSKFLNIKQYKIKNRSGSEYVYLEVKNHKVQ